MSRSSPAYTRLRQEGDDDELVSPVADEDVKPLELPASQQTSPVAETKEEAPEIAPPIQSGHEPAMSTAMPPPEYQPAAVPVGLPPGQQPAGVPPTGFTPVAAATAMNTTTVVQTQPGVGMAVLYPQTKPDNYLALSIFSMLCCCFIFGLIGLIYSLQVDSSWSVGDYEGAQQAARNAKRWDIAAIITGLVFGAIGGILLLVQLIGYTVVVHRS